MIKPKLIEVVYGGFSGEREVSLKSGVVIAESLEKAGYCVELTDIQSPVWNPKPGVEFVFIGLHGAYGEDGKIQSKMDDLGISYSGSSSRSSHLAFNKYLSKEVFIKSGLSTPNGVTVSGIEQTRQTNFSTPLVVKPVSDGSSLGLEFVDHAEQLESAVQNCMRVTDQVLIEERIYGRELTVGILGDETLPIIEIRPQEGGYNYKNKYTAGGAEHICPAELTGKEQNKVIQLAMAAFRSLGCSHYGRVDIMLDRDSNPFVLEVNTLPGMTEFSLLPEAAQEVGITLPELCSQIVELSWKESSEKLNASDG